MYTNYVECETNALPLGIWEKYIPNPLFGRVEIMQDGEIMKNIYKGRVDEGKQVKF